MGSGFSFHSQTMYLVDARAIIGARPPPVLPRKDDSFTLEMILPIDSMQDREPYVVHEWYMYGHHMITAPAMWGIEKVGVWWWLFFFFFLSRVRGF